MTGSYDMSRLTLLARCVSAKFIWTDKLLSRGSKKPYKVVVGFNMDRCDESAKAIFEKDVINVKNVNGLYGAHVNTCEDCELFATPTEPIRGIYCARAQRFVCQHNPACKDFEPQTKEESDE